MGIRFEGTDMPASVKNEIRYANVGPHNLADEMKYFYMANGPKMFSNDMTVESLMSQLTTLMREDIVSKDFLNLENLSSKQKNGLITLYNYVIKCPDKDLTRLERYTQCLLTNKILTKDTLMPMHLDKIAELKGIEKGVCKRKDSHMSRYYQPTYRERTSGEIRERLSSSKSWGRLNDSSMYYLAINMLTRDMSNIRTYTNMELHAIKKSLLNLIEDAIQKGHNDEACQMLKILGDSKFTKRMEQVKFKTEKLIIDMMLEYFDKMMWSFAKHTRNMVLTDEAIDYNLQYRKLPDVVPHKDIAKGSKANDVIMFINDIFNGKYGKAFAGNMGLKNKLLARYNHYLDSSHRDINGAGNPEVINTINAYLEDQKI